MVLRELSKLTKEPQSRLISELLDQTLPALLMTVQALKNVKERPEQVQAMLSDYCSGAINQVTQAQLDLSAALKLKPGRKPKGSSGRKP